MNTNPILMNDEMVRATLREIETPGTGKTQTRRIIKKSFDDFDDDGWPVVENDMGDFVRLQCPYGQPGDLLWVRETHISHDLGRVTYAADCSINPKQDKAHGVIWTPSVHMPRWASRITLEVDDIQGKRLRDDSPDILMNEVGFSESLEDEDSPAGREFSRAEYYAIGGSPMQMIPEMFGYAAWWDDRFGQGSFDANPWVWVVSFKPHLINVDQFTKDADK